MKQKFGTKIRIITAIEKSDYRLLAHLLGSQNHPPSKPVDKLGNTILHVACGIGNLPMVQHIVSTYNLSIHSYNTDGMNCMHLATCSISLDIIQWLHSQGADCQAKTTKYQRTSYDLICEMIKNKEVPDNQKSITREVKRKMVEIKNFFMARFFEDNRSTDIRKFLWVYGKLKNNKQDIGNLPAGMIREIAEYI